MRTEATYGGAAERIGEPVRPGEGLVGEVVQRDEPMLEDGAPPFRCAGTAGCAVRSRWASNANRAVSPEELELLEAFGELAAAACRNASAHAGLALAARTDALTGCLNHAAMHDALGREVERCRRKGHALSLVIVDLDEFKQVNERHGHLAGDEVLRQVGESLRESVRAYDLVARYGGDEFAVIAMDADEATATEVARRAVEAIGRALGTLGSAGEATAATAGVAEWQAGDSPSALIARADRALLHGKHRACAAPRCRRPRCPRPPPGAPAQAAADSESSSARQSRSTLASGRPKTSTSTARAPRSSSGLMASATAARRAALALEHAEDRAAEQHGVARRGRELGPAALAEPAHDRRAQVGRLTGQPHGAALAEPGPAHVAPERGGRERRRQVRVVGADHEVRVLVKRRQEQGLARARDLRGAPLERGGGEHVDVRLGEPAREVAAAGGRGDAAREREPRMGERERGHARVEHHGDVARRVLEQPRHLVPERLERLEHGSGLGALRRVVASRERRRMRLLPGHGRTIRHSRGSDPLEVGPLPSAPPY